MKMVASSKLHRAQVAIENMLPYEDTLEHILKTFLVSTPEIVGPFNAEHAKVRNVALVVFTSNSSLCGAFNVNVIKMMDDAIREYRGEGVESITVYPIGRKVAEALKKRKGIASGGTFDDIADKPNASKCRDIAINLARLYTKGKLDKVELIYHHFKSAGSQILTRKTFLPIDLSTESIGGDNDRDLSQSIATLKAQEYLRKRDKEEQAKEEREIKPLNDNFIVEPDLETVLKSLIPKQLHLMLYTALLDSQASEHAARMVAMQTATDNADDILRELNLQYNKSRQQAITSELLDIVGGSTNN